MARLPRLLQLLLQHQQCVLKESRTRQIAAAAGGLQQHLCLQPVAADALLTLFSDCKLADTEVSVGGSSNSSSRDNSRKEWRKRDSRIQQCYMLSGLRLR